MMMPKRAHLRGSLFALVPVVQVMMVLYGCADADQTSDLSVSEAVTEAAAEERWRAGGIGADEEIALVAPPRGAAFGPHGLRAVVDGAARILLLDGEGRLVRTIGRSGQGPGEFASAARVGFLGDSILWASDAVLRRLTYFTAEGEALRTARQLQMDLPGGAGVAVASRVLADGGFLGTTTGGSETRDGSPVPRAVTVWSAEGEGTILQWLDGAPERVEVRMGGSPRPVSTTQPIQAWPIVNAAPGGEWFFVLDRLPAASKEGPSTFRIRRYDPSGNPLGDWSIQYEPQALDKEVRTFLEGFAGALGAATGVDADAFMEAFWIPSHLPPVRTALSDSDGFWIQRERTRPGLWERYDLEGQLVHTAQLPPDFHGLASADSLLLGWELGDLDVPVLVEFLITPKR